MRELIVTAIMFCLAFAPFGAIVGGIIGWDYGPLLGALRGALIACLFGLIGLLLLISSLSLDVVSQALSLSPTLSVIAVLSLFAAIVGAAVGSNVGSRWIESALQGVAINMIALYSGFTVLTLRFDFPFLDRVVMLFWIAAILGALFGYTVRFGYAVRSAASVTGIIIGVTIFQVGLVATWLATILYR